MGSGSAGQVGVKDGYLRGALSRPATQRQMDVLAAFVAAGSVSDAAKLVGIRPSTVKRTWSALPCSGLRAPARSRGTGSECFCRE